jgi:site-specific DNA-cytosine methylase
MKVLELFSGTESFSKVCRERGHDTFTIDIDKKFKPDLCINILDFDISMLPGKFRNPDIIWSSPPCTTFSVASISRYWDKGKPKNEKALEGIAIVKKTIEIIKQLKPKFWIIENPRGMLRKQEIMRGLHRDSVCYCRYGDSRMKPTDIWNNLNHKFKPMCKNGNRDHQVASRGTGAGTQGLSCAKERSVIPPALCLEIIKACENNKESQKTLCV